MNTPRDIVNYIFDNHLEADFFNSTALHKGDFTIAEIVDKKFIKFPDGFNLKSDGYHINVEIKDDDVLTALYNDLYVSAFISLKGEEARVHFLVHQYPVSMKAKFDEAIMDEVLRYMALMTVIALRLDTEKKVDDYIKP